MLIEGHIRRGPDVDGECKEAGRDDTHGRFNNHGGRGNNLEATVKGTLAEGVKRRTRLRYCHAPGVREADVIGGILPVRVY
jgi:hypothetical protein